MICSLVWWHNKFLNDLSCQNHCLFQWNHEMIVFNYFRWYFCSWIWPTIMFRWNLMMLQLRMHSRMASRAPGWIHMNSGYFPLRISQRMPAPGWIRVLFCIFLIKNQLKNGLQRMKSVLLALGWWNHFFFDDLSLTNQL